MDNHKTELVHVEGRDVQRARMHPLVGAAMDRGAITDPATLRELLAVQRDWEAGEAKKAYTRALAALKADLPTVIAKDALVDFTSEKSGKRTTYRHTTLAAVMDAVTEPLTRHGFSLSWTPATSERSVRVTCRLTHTEGHHEEATLEAPPDGSGMKSPAQGIASTITLLSRYSALALLGIATRDMTEPAGEQQPTEPDLTEVDAAKNMRAAAAIVKAGRKREDAEQLVGRVVAQWTRADLRKIKAWLEPKSERQPSEDEQRQQDEDLRQAARENA